MDTEEDFIAEMGRAVWRDDDPIRVKAALDQGFDPNYYDMDGATTLHRVVEAGCVQALEVLLQHDITRLDVKDHILRTPLHYSARCHNVETITAICDHLINAGLRIDDSCNDIEYPTALFQCLRYKNIRVAAHLLRRGADIELKNFSQASLLLQLVEDSPDYDAEELEEMVALFLYYNVDANFPFQCHPIVLALKLENTLLVNMLAEHFAGYDYLEYIKLKCSKGAFVIGTLMQCVDMNLHVDVTIAIASKLDFGAQELIDALVYSGRASQIKLFSYFYDKWERKSRGSNALADGTCDVCPFFDFIVLPREDLFHGIETLFQHELGRLWRPHSIACVLPLLLGALKTQYSITNDEMAGFFGLMFPYLDVICGRVLYDCLEVAGFTDDFALLIKYDPVVLFRCCSPYMLDPLYMRICYPTLPVMGCAQAVPSLRQLSRDEIRKHLGLRAEICRQPNTTKRIFAYYNAVQKLDIPEILKDVITLKRYV